MGKLSRAAATTTVAAGLLAVALAPAEASTPRSADPGQLPYSSATWVGVHNAYEKAKYPYFADALDSGAGMLELDVWTNVFGRSWRVSHSNPIGNNNNCENAATPAELRTKASNQDLGGCLADMKAWHDAHPGHRPILIKIEMKDGFQDNNGRGPAALDALLSAQLGDALFRPADLAGGHPDLDTAVRTDGWPARSALAGKFVVELIPGTVEEGNPADTLWTDREYATHLRDLAAAGGSARRPPSPPSTAPPPATPAPGTPTPHPPLVRPLRRGRRYVCGRLVDTAWYDRNHYLVVMTDAHNVAPAIDGTNPTETQARDRVGLLAGRHASVVSADWYPLPSVLATVVPRGGGQ